MLTTSADNVTRTFVAPTTLLELHSEPLVLSPYTAHFSPEPIYAITPYPFYSLQDPQTTLVLTSPRDLPIRLTNVLSSDPKPTATYPLISPTTEAFLTPASLLFHPDGTHFYTGTDCLITLFDVSRQGQGPATRLPTIPSKRHKLKGGGVGMRGIVSALALQPGSTAGSSSALLAAGAWTRQLALYDAAGMGGTVSTWSIDSAADIDTKIGGAGVSQVLWSPCGRYLFVVERKSSGILVYDVRVTGRLLGSFTGRKAETNQRLQVQIEDCGGQGMAIWAGGMDGVVRVWNWKGIAGNETGDGEIEEMIPEWEWNAHGSSVTSVAVHPSGTVVATSSGERKELTVDVSLEHDSSGDSDSEEEKEEFWVAEKPTDNSVKIWKL